MHLVGDQPVPTLRAATPEDDGFLFDLYTENRREPLVRMGWPDAQIVPFLRLQYDLRKRAYASIPGISDYVVEIQGKAAGTLSLSRTPERFHLVNIALGPAWCGRGVGSRLIRDVIEEASLEGKGVGLSVELTNRAANLYRKLGFAAIGSDGVYMKMERMPNR